MKKILSLLLSLTLILGICAPMAMAEETATVVTGMTSANDTVQWSYDTSTKTITFSIAEGKTGTTWSGIGDAKVAGYKDYVSEIEKVVVSEGIIRIGSGAFAYSVPNLTEVTLPSTLTAIGDNAFLSCKALTTLNVNHSARFTVGAGAFNGCTGLMRSGILVIPEGVTSIGDRAFNGFQALKTLIIPNTVTNIDDFAFRNAVQLTSAAIPASVTTIGTNAFVTNDNGDKITTLTIKCVEGSEADTFAKSREYPVEYIDGCGVAGTIGWVLNDNVLTVTGEGAIPDYTASAAPWAGLSNEIRTVVVGEGVTAIGAGAFAGCASIKNVQLPSTLTAIGAGAFDSAKLMAVVLPDSVTAVGNAAFAGDTELCVSTASSFKDTEGYAVKVDGNSYTGTTPAAGGATITYGVYKNGDVYTLVIGGSGQMAGNVSATSAPWYASYGDKITKVVFEYGVTRVAQNLFNGNTVITSASLSDSIVTLQPYVFNGCSALTVINNSNSLTYVGGYAYNGTSVTELEIPSSIATGTIAGMGFGGMSRLTKLELPSNMTTIPDSAFEKLAALKELTIPSGVTTIGARAFFNAARLEKLYIPASVTSIADTAFGSAGYLLSGYVAGESTPTTIYCTKGSAAEAYAEENGFNCVSYTASGVAGELSWVLDEGKLYIEGTGVIPDYSAASATPWATYAEDITDIQLADTVTGIGAYAFAGLTGLTELSIPDTVTSIGENAFSGCTNLVIFASEDSAAATYANENNIPLTIGGTLSTGIVWKVKDGVLTLTGTGEITERPWNGKNWFVNGIHTIVVGEGITKISGRAFERGVAIENVIFPSTATYIDHSILNEAPSLEFAEIPANVTTLGGVFGSPGIKRLALLNNTDTKISEVLKNQVRDDLTVIVTAENTAIKANAANSGINFETVKANGTEGTIRWIVTEEGSLDIYGMGDLSALTAAPWADYAASIKNVYIHEGITGVGTGLFANVSGAYIELADTISTLGENALSGQNNSVRVPVYVKTIAANAFGADTTIMSYKNSYAKTYAEANSITFEERSSLRMLAIGNSYTEDMCEWIYSMANEAGIEDVVVANLMYPGRNLKAIYEHIEDGDEDYIYYNHTYSASRHVTTSNVNIDYGLTAEEWDVIALQAWYPEAAYGLDGIEEGETEWLSYITDYIKSKATNPNVELAFNMVWAQEREVSDDVTNPADYTKGHNRNNYGDTVTEYNRIANQTKAHFGEGSTLGYTYVLPIGTGIENARTSYLAGLRGQVTTSWGSNSYLEGGLQRDTCHLNHLGKYVADLIWMDVLTDVEIDDITYTPAVTYADGTEVFDENVVAVAKEAAKAAIAKPYEITASSTPYRIMGYADGNVTVAASNVVRTTNQDTATEAKAQAAKVVFAEYTTEGDFVQCVTVDANIVYDEELSSAEYAPPEAKEYTKNIIADGTFEPTAGNKVKVMLWNADSDMVPLAAYIAE